MHRLWCIMLTMEGLWLPFNYFLCTKWFGGDFYSLLNLNELKLKCFFYLLFFPAWAQESHNKYGRLIGDLSNFAHGIVGRVYAVTDEILFIKGFEYDGTGPGRYSLYFIALWYKLVNTWMVGFYLFLCGRGGGELGYILMGFGWTLY